MMNYYDEEIPVSGVAGAADIKPPNNVKVERISSRGSNSDRANALDSVRSVAVRQGSDGGVMLGRPRQRMMVSV